MNEWLALSGAFPVKEARPKKNKIKNNRKGKSIKCLQKGF